VEIEAEIQGIKWHDFDRDGWIDDSEEGIEDWLITLSSGVDDDWVVVAGPVETNASGGYTSPILVRARTRSRKGPSPVGNPPTRCRTTTTS